MNKVMRNEVDPVPIQEEIERIFAAKREWHRKQATLPMKEKVRILLEIQKAAFPLIAKRRKLESWEKPWEIEP